MSRDMQVFIVAVAAVLVLLVGMGYGDSVGTRRAYRQFITGRIPLPVEHLDAVLDSLSMEYDVLLKDKPADTTTPTPKLGE